MESQHLHQSKLVQVHHQLIQQRSASKLPQMEVPRAMQQIDPLQCSMDMAPHLYTALQQLEGLLERFYAPQLSTVDKMDIESRLAQFRAQNDSWRQCGYFLRFSKSQYVQWFALTVYEDLVFRQWSQLEQATREQLKHFFFQHLRVHHSSLAPFTLNKLITLVVSIAKRDWPLEYPQLLPDIQSLLQQDDASRDIGLRCLKCLSEEFTSTAVGQVPFTRQQQLRGLLQQQVPMLMQWLIDGYLAPAYQQYFNVQLFQSLSEKPQNNSISSAVHSSLLRALECVGAYVTWIPLAECLSLTHVQVLCRYALLGPTNIELSGQALTCITEMMSRPVAWKPALPIVFTCTCNILEQLIACPVDRALQEPLDECLNKAKPWLAAQEETLLTRATALITALAAQQLHRFQVDCQLPVDRFILLVLIYTVSQPTAESILACLDAWHSVVDYVLHHRNQQAATYQSLLLSATEQIFSVLLRQDLQSTLNDTVEDKQRMTEWDRFVNDCVEWISKVAELYPEPILSFMFHSMHRFNDLSSASSQRNLRTALFIVARLNDRVSSDPQHFALGKSFMSEFLQWSGIILAQQNSGKLANQIIYTIQGYVYWLSLFSQLNPDEAIPLKNGVLELALAVLSSAAHEKLYLSAASLLCTATSLLDYESFMSRPLVQNLFPRLASSPIQEWQCVVIKAIVNVHVLSYGKQVQQQNWEQRGTSLKAFLLPLLQQAPLLSTLQIANSVISCVQDQGNYSKQSLYFALSEILSYISLKLEQCIEQADLLRACIHLYSNLFPVMHGQYGVPALMNQTLSLTLVTLSPRLSTLLTSESGTATVNSALKWMTFVMSLPGKQNPFTEPILNFCVDAVYPLLENNIAIQPCFYTLLRTVLNYQWNVFFPSSISHSASGVANENRERLFILLMQMLGRSFQSSQDLETFKQNLETLQSLHAKNQLFQKPLFQQTLRNPFVSVFLRLLVQGSHDILREEVISVLFYISNVDMDAFYSIVLCILQESPILTNEARMALSQHLTPPAKDCPTFSQQIQAFVNDFQYFERLCKV